MSSTKQGLNSLCFFCTVTILLFLRNLKIMDKNVRIDLFTVEATRDGLTAIQSQLNQWHTKGELIKFETQPVGDKLIFFKVLRKKGAA